MAVTWNTKCKWQTGYSADSVEWCPVEPCRHVLVCGTYQLDKSDQGNMQVFSDSFVVVTCNTKCKWQTGYSADSVEWCPVEPCRHVLVCGTYQLDKSDQGNMQVFSDSFVVVTWNTKCKWQTGYSADSVEWCPVEPCRRVLVCGTYQLDKSDRGNMQVFSDSFVVVTCNTKCKWQTGYSADSVEWCPVEPCRHVLVCGTYQLDKSDQGNMQVFSDSFVVVTWNTKCKWQTGYSADSVEWCPREPCRHVLVCGTYQLDKSDQETKDADQPKQKRLGRIYLFLLDKITTEISPTQTIDTAGILDMKWCYHNIQGHPVLAAVTSDGYIQLYQLLDENGTLKLELWIEDAICGNVLALSVDWSTNKTSTAQPSLVVSDSSGAVTVFRIFGRSLEKIGYWLGHSFEAWIAAFNYWNPDVFYSGGDDCMFKSYDVRVPDVPTATNRSHEAGVTAIRSHIHVEHQLLTGSYDEKVRLWDARSLKRFITERDVNGGVWRLKWHPSDTSVVLAACMYGGFRVLRVTDEVAVLCEYVEHESIAYGADWQFDKSTAESDDKSTVKSDDKSTVKSDDKSTAESDDKSTVKSDDKSTAESDDKSIVATCSFYDCSMHIGEIVIQKLQ